MTIRNDFHNTQAEVHPKFGGGHAALNKGQVHRAKAILCGLKDCTCGGHLGERGPQDWRAEIVPTASGGVNLYFSPA